MVKASSGDLYVVATVGPAGSTDTYVARVAPSGVTVWSKRFNLSAETRDDTAFGATVDANDNVYVTGEAYQTSVVGGNVRSAFVTKLSPGGNIGFTRYYSISSTESARGRVVAVNSAGDIAVCVENSEDRVWKLNADGITQWVRKPIIISDCKSMIMDNSGSIYLGGTRLNSGSDGAPAIQKLNSDGILQWTRWVNYDSAVSSVDVVNAMKMDPLGHIFATGVASNHGSDFALIKVAPTGDVLATRLLNSAGTNDDTAYSVHLGPNDDVYIGGSMTGPSIGGFMVAKAGLDATFGWKKFSPNAAGSVNVYQGACFNEFTGQFLAISHNTVNGSALLQSVGQPGVSKPDAYTVPQNTTYNGATVFANDVYAADGTALLVDGATNGTVMLNADGTFTYQPNASFTGTDTFTYRIVKPGVFTSFVTTVTLTVQ